MNANATQTTVPATLYISRDVTTADGIYLDEIKGDPFRSTCVAVEIDLPAGYHVEESVGCGKRVYREGPTSSMADLSPDLILYSGRAARGKNSLNHLGTWAVVLNGERLPFRLAA